MLFHLKLIPVNEDQIQIHLSPSVGVMQEFRQLQRKTQMDGNSGNRLLKKKNKLWPYISENIENEKLDQEQTYVWILLNQMRSGKLIELL